jgi:uncharacterized protein (TIGR02145 family)
MSTIKLFFTGITVLSILSALTCTKNPAGSNPGPVINPGSVTDIDGNVYHTVKLGNQVWTVENLRTTKFNDGSAIPLVQDGAIWNNLVTPGHWFFENSTDTVSINKFGALYNWYAIDTKRLAPAGWHVPTDAEWETLQNYLIANGYNWDSSTVDNKIGKSLAAITDWDASTVPGTIGDDVTKNNRTGFSALPGGYRGENFYGIGACGNYWSATQNNADAMGAYYRSLCYNDARLGWSADKKKMGMSVRLVMD